jgi:general transcription factor 3C polypeptide 3 (transcription factor C subunit 4)
MEAVRLAPHAPDIYHTLAEVHEAAGDPRRALDFLMLAVHMAPKAVRSGVAGMGQGGA